jgi:hypothetical protein
MMVSGITLENLTLGFSNLIWQHLQSLAHLTRFKLKARLALI